MVNPDVDDYSKTLNHPNMLRKTQTKQQPTENQKNTKTKIQAKWGPVFTFSLPGGGSHPCNLLGTQLLTLQNSC